MKKAPNILVVTAVMALLAGLTAFAVDMNLPAIPVIAREFGDTTESIQLSISIFLLFFGGGQLLYGPISDSLGRRRVINAGLMFYLAASFAITQVNSYELLLAWRIVQALGGAAISVSVVASLRDLYSGNHLAKMTSYLAMIMAVAPMAAPFIGAILLSYFHWQSIFVTLFILGLAGGLLYNTLLPESLTPDRRVPLNFGEALKGYGVVIKDRQSLMYLVILSFSSTPMFIFVTCSPLVYMEYLGVSSQHYPFYFAINVVAMMAHSWLNTRLLGRLDYTRILRLGVRLALIPSALLMVVGLFLPFQWLLWTMAPLTALTIGLGVLINANASAGLMTRHARNAGSAASLSGTARFGSGAVVGIAVNLLSTGDHLAMVTAILICTLTSALALHLLAKIQAQAAFNDTRQ